MSFNIGLSGLRAATKDLNVTGNNIANAGTAGFKQSRQSLLMCTPHPYWVQEKINKAVVCCFRMCRNCLIRATLTTRKMRLDLAINGNGFFQVSNNGAISYSRAGYFGTDREGFIVDNFGYNLQGYTTDANGELKVGTVYNLQIKTSSQDPRPTSKIEQSYKFKLDKRCANKCTPFSATDPKSYNSSTSTNIYDTQGNAHASTPVFCEDWGK